MWRASGLIRSTLVPEAGSERRRVILVVDDERDGRELAERTLRGRWDVLVASSGLEALARLGERQVDLLVTDHRMPDMTGVELVRRTRVSHPKLPAILVSAYEDSQMLVEALDLGVSRFLAKPFRGDDLAHVVESTLASRSSSLSTVLVVDDSGEIRELLATALARAGHRALCASNATEALSVARSNRLDLALVDIALPGTSGLELTAALKSERPLMPVIIVSAVESVDVALEAMRLGVSDYVTKPFRFREILFRVERALETAGRAIQAASARHAGPSDLPPLRDALDAAERTYLVRLLDSAAGDLEQAALRAEVSRAELTDRLLRLGLAPSKKT